VLAAELDVGLALFPEAMRGVGGELLRMEPLALLLGEHHPLAETDPVPLASLANETLLTFPRERAPRHYDRVIAACEQAGFQPRVTTFANPPPQAMVARLRATHEVGLPPASFAFHAGAAEPGIVARRIVEPEILEWSILWAGHTQSAAVAHFLDDAPRRTAGCSCRTT
jgi:DNA-binding transcriptional LysR family regulator